MGVPSGVSGEEYLHSSFPGIDREYRDGALRPGRFLIPDVAVFYLEEPGLIPDTPPLIAVEILSPDDQLSELREKLEEYRVWNVPHVWLVDPHSRRLCSCDEGLREVSRFNVAELAIEVTAHQIFE